MMHGNYFGKYHGSWWGKLKATVEKIAIDFTRQIVAFTAPAVSYVKSVYDDIFVQEKK